MLNEPYTSCFVMVKSTFTLQELLMPQFQGLVVSMSPKYMWNTVYLGSIRTLLIGSTDPCLPDISVARGNKGYTGDLVQLSVIT